MKAFKGRFVASDSLTPKDGRDYITHLIHIKSKYFETMRLKRRNIYLKLSLPHRLL